MTARGDLSVVIIGLVGTRPDSLDDLVSACALVLATLGPLSARAPAPRLLVGQSVKLLDT